LSPGKEKKFKKNYRKSWGTAQEEERLLGFLRVESLGQVMNLNTSRKERKWGKKRVLGKA